MRVLCVGAAGYVGNIIRPALKQAHDCWYYDLRSPVGEEERTCVADVNDPTAIARALKDKEAVVYLAMGTDGNWPDDLVKNSFDVNVMGLYRLLDASATAGVQRFVYASSLSVYERLSKRGVVYEGMPADAWDAYGLTKRLGEAVCAAAAQASSNLTIISMRLMAPRSEQDWPGNEYEDGREDNLCALGPNDTARLFLAALACSRPGAHVIQASGDLENNHFPNIMATQLLGWKPFGN